MAFTDLPPIALVQMEVIPGRPERNAARMVDFIDDARKVGAEVVVFSEMCIPGYLMGDIWELDTLVEDFAAYSDQIRAASRGMTVIFGNVVIDKDTIGEDGRWRKYNAVHVCHDGQAVGRDAVPAGLPAGVHPKTLHPNYRFFDDDRHFYSLRKLAESTGRSVYDWMVPFEVPRRDGGSFRFGVQLCEDIWCQDYNCGGDTLDTLRAYHANGAQAVFNLSASPWTWQKNDKRNRTVREVLARSPLPFFYVNHVGAQNNGKNILVFDGDTTAYDSDGSIRARYSLVRGHARCRQERLAGQRRAKRDRSHSRCAADGDRAPGRHPRPGQPLPHRRQRWHRFERGGVSTRASLRSRAGIRR